MNLFENIKPPVDFKGERVTLDEILESDGDKLLELSADVENNRYWGYDYREEDGYENTAKYFLDFVKRMKESKEEYSVAVRADGKFVGEAVFHNFDCDGAVELGVRILPRYQNCGYGTDTVKTMAAYGLTVLKAKTLKMKCFRENTASEKMIRKAGFDEIARNDTYIFFQRN